MSAQLYSKMLPPKRSLNFVRYFGGKVKTSNVRLQQLLQESATKKERSVKDSTKYLQNCQRKRDWKNALLTVKDLHNRNLSSEETWLRVLGIAASTKKLEPCMHVLTEMRNDNIPTTSGVYRHLLDACNYEGRSEEAFQLFQEMKLQTITPFTDHICNSLLSVFGNKVQYQRIQEVLSIMEEHNIAKNASTQKTLLRIYTSMKNLDKAMSSLREVKQSELHGGNFDQLLSICAEDGNVVVGEEVLNTFKHMRPFLPKIRGLIVKLYARAYDFDKVLEMRSLFVQLREARASDCLGFITAANFLNKEKGTELDECMIYLKQLQPQQIDEILAQALSVMNKEQSAEFNKMLSSHNVKIDGEGVKLSLIEKTGQEGDVNTVLKLWKELEKETSEPSGVMTKAAYGKQMEAFATVLNVLFECGTRRQRLDFYTSAVNRKLINHWENEISKADNTINFTQRSLNCIKVALDFQMQHLLEEHRKRTKARQVRYVRSLTLIIGKGLESDRFLELLQDELQKLDPPLVATTCSFVNPGRVVVMANEVLNWCHMNVDRDFPPT